MRTKTEPFDPANYLLDAADEVAYLREAEMAASEAHYLEACRAVQRARAARPFTVDANELLDSKWVTEA